MGAMNNPKGPSSISGCEFKLRVAGRGELGLAEQSAPFLCEMGLCRWEMAFQGERVPGGGDPRESRFQGE